MSKIPRLPLGLDERIAIREAGFRLSMLHKTNAQELARLAGIPLKYCEKLIALSQFQTLTSVGPATAEDLWVLGYRTISDLKGANPRGMYKRMMRLTGKPVDP